jgi:hypothetical protein
MAGSWSVEWALAEGGVGGAAADDGEVIALAAGDLGGEDLVEGAGEFGACRDGHRRLLVVDEPVEVAPRLRSRRRCSGPM